jgi:mono/diheme cytochrome c family protein
MRSLGLAIVLIVRASLASGEDAAEPGRALYLRYCSACHGPAGKGDGIAGAFMRPKPIDLTLLTRRNRGEFPFQRTLQAIDGTTQVRPHGESEMPVWGEVLREPLAITNYIRSIQSK